jgi:hypothetical protein
VAVAAAAALWIFAAVPLGTTYLQAAADLRTYRADPACTAGIAAEPGLPGGCGVGTIVVGGARPVADGRYSLSVKFADGARRELPISAAGYRFLHRPGTLAFVQVRQRRITLIGDERYAETTADHPLRRIARARDAALVALAGACALTVAAAAAVRRDVALRRSNLAR